MTDMEEDEKLMELDDADRPAKMSITEQAFALVGVLFTLIAMFHIAANVLMRHLFFESPIRAALEMTGCWYLPLICMAGFIIAQLRNAYRLAIALRPDAREGSGQPTAFRPSSGRGNLGHIYQLYRARGFGGS